MKAKFDYTICNYLEYTDVYCVEDLTFSSLGLNKNTDKEDRIYSENVYLFNLDFFQYFHSLHEGIGQYELLKEKIDNLKIVPIANSANFSGREKSMHTLLELIKPYGLKYEDIVFLSSESPLFKKVFFYSTIGNPLLSQLDIPQGKFIYGTDTYITDGFKKVRRLYDKYLTKDELLPKKIFFSRMKQDDRVRDIYNLMRNRDNLSMAQRARLKQEELNMGGERYLLQLINERYISLEQEKELEDFFKNNGYVIIDPEDFSFYDQIQYYYNATHIAAIRGSGLVNTIFSQDEVSIFIIDTTQAYEYDYKTICSLNSTNVYEIPFDMKLKKFMDDSLFNIKNITSIIDSHYKEKI
jgi:hypothetical protein